MLSAMETWGVLGIGQLVGLGLAGTLSEADLVERFFNKMERDDYKLGVAARIHLLEEAGYIQGHSFLRQPKAFTVTQKGLKALSDEPESCRPNVRDVVSEALIKHDLKVSAVGLLLTQVLGLDACRQHPKAVWTIIHGRRHLTVEGCADLKIESQTQPRDIEVELTQKSKERYQEIFATHRSRQEPGGAVLYMTGWPGGAEMILRRARDERAPFIYVCALDEVRASAGRCLFQGAVPDRTLRLSDRSPVAASAEGAR
jgi:hypothetical protein